jgi:hypothetical protein
MTSITRINTLALEAAVRLTRAQPRCEDLFSSPQKQAQSAATTAEGISSQEIGSPGPINVPNANGGSTTVAPSGSGLEGYIQTEQEAEQAAIAGLGTNPYFSAAGNMSPSNYAVNPADTVTFSNQGPGTTAGTPSSASTPPNLFASPAPGGATMVPPSSPISQPPTGRQPTAPPGQPGTPVYQPPPNNVTGPILSPTHSGGLL